MFRLFLRQNWMVLSLLAWLPALQAGPAHAFTFLDCGTLDQTQRAVEKVDDLATFIQQNETNDQLIIQRLRYGLPLVECTRVDGFSDQYEVMKTNARRWLTFGTKTFQSMNQLQIHVRDAHTLDGLNATVTSIIRTTSDRYLVRIGEEPAQPSAQ